MSLHDSLESIKHWTSGLYAYITKISIEGNLLCCTLVVNAKQEEKEFQNLENIMANRIYHRHAWHGRDHPLMRTYEIALPFKDTEGSFIHQMKRSIREHHAFPVNVT